MRHEIRLFEVVATYRLSPIPMPDGSPALRFRIEILRGSDGRYSSRVFRLDCYRVQPTFPLDGDTPMDDAADELVEVEDLNSWSNRQFDTRLEALEDVVAKMRSTFAHCDFL